MAYHALTISVPTASREAVIGKLHDLGGLGIVDDDRTVTCYFDGRTDISRVEAALDRFRDVLASAGLDPSFTIARAVIPDQDWSGEWKKSFVPFDVGERLTVMPSWARKETSRIPVIVDPAMAFGTGHHETTRSCLQVIEKYSRTANLKSFLDIGTGTGILAIAAAKLGFSPVVAIDNDPAAVDAARTNISLNGVGTIDLRTGDLSAVPKAFDLIAANLIATTLIGIAPDIASRLNPAGRAVLSGILGEQESGVVDAMESCGLAVMERIVDGAWVTLVAGHRDPHDARHGQLLKKTAYL